MSILMLVDDSSADIKLIEWYKDPKFSIQYPTLPVEEMTWAEFLEKGWRFVQEHFERHRVIRLMRDGTGDLYKDTNGKRMLKRQNVLLIYDDAYSEGDILIAPMRFKKYDLGGFVDMDDVSKGRVSIKGSDEDFAREVGRVINAMKG